MRVHHYLAIALKIFSIILVIYSLRFFTTLIEAIRYNTINGVIVNEWFVVFNLLIVWSIAAMLWFFPLTVSKSFVRGELDQTVEPLATSSILTISVAVIGVFTLSNGIIDIVYWSILIHMSQDSSFSVASPEATSGVTSTVLEVVIGAFLIFKSRTIAGYIDRVAK